MSAAASPRKERPETQRKRIGRPFPPKNAGKPRGARDRRTLVGIEVCRAMACRAADRLAALIDSRSHRVAFEASRLVLAYAWGAPRQTLEVTGLGDLAGELTEALRAARERRALESPAPATALEAAERPRVPECSESEALTRTRSAPGEVAS